ncbi:hypothetical protein MASR2M29_12870 [Spirochaetota bacterium]
MENKAQEAAAVLELAIKEPGSDEKLYLYLGIAYQQQGKWDEAINAFRKGLPMAVLYKHQLLFNIANSFYAQGRNSFALDYYDQAIKAEPNYSNAYLNRANTKMRLGDQNGALTDYAVYLSIDQDSKQQAEIRRLIELLGLRAAEADKKKAEEEARKLAEEKARQTMREEVARTLLEAAESTTSLSAGSAEVQSYESELSLDD